MKRLSLLALATASALSLSPLPAAAAQPLPVAAPEDVGVSALRLDRLSDYLEGLVAEERLPGAVLLVARDGRQVHEEVVGWADIADRRPMTRDALFRIASQTKAVVSVAVMMLQEEGRLLLHDPLSRYLPEFAETTVAVDDGAGGFEEVPARRPITIRDLLTHTAGIGYGYGPGEAVWKEAGVQSFYLLDRDEPIRGAARRMAALPMDAHPGERFVYGYATDILGAVVEVASGLTLDAFLRARIFDPLGMHDTHFYVPAGKASRLATLYNVRDGRLRRAPDGAGITAQGEFVEGPRTLFSGGAGLVSTAGDYLRFLQMLLNGGQLDGARLLAPGTVELMTRDHLGEVYAPAGLGFGLGFEVTEDAGLAGAPQADGAYRWGGAYHTTYWVDPVEGLAVVYMTQVIPATGLDDHGKVRALVYQALIASRR